MTQTSVRWIATGLVILVMSLTLEAAKRPSIGVSPKGATLQSGQTLQFTATILRSTGTPVWSAMGGTITTTGLYTAGSVAGSAAYTGFSSLPVSGFRPGLSAR